MKGYKLMLVFNVVVMLLLPITDYLMTSGAVLQELVDEPKIAALVLGLIGAINIGLRAISVKLAAMELVKRSRAHADTVPMERDS